MWTLLGVYWVTVMLGHLNIGHRHLLPTYPPLFVLAGAAAYWLEGWREAGRANRSAAGTLPGRITGVVLCALVALLAGQMLCFFPNYLAYFNAIAGGPAHAYRHLVDSSLDWGQELPGRRTYLERARDRRDPFTCRISAAPAPTITCRRPNTSGISTPTSARTIGPPCSW